VFVELLAEVFASAVRVQHLNLGAMLLSDCPGLEEFVGLEGFTLLAQQVTE